MTPKDLRLDTELPETRSLPDPSVLLQETAWASYEHALGAAEDTAAALTRLLDDDIAARADALRHLEQTVHHQNSIYSATVPVALYVASILVDPRTATAGIYRRDNRHRPLRAVLLDWLGEMADDVSDDAVAVHQRLGFFPLEEYSELVELRSLRPTIFNAVCAFLRDPEPHVADAAVITASLLLDGADVAHHQANLASLVHRVLLTSTDRTHRAHARRLLHRWGEPTPPELEVTGQGPEPPF
ncbi:hypothetical protein [Rugosimonospora africana]|uniref:HEAT repeat domain-containing protein n=1 Tax=Rugosimonospora africana TaxID=556532 RepID=A0A8J3VW38_9ACTN|nr:hypothetical protein [Rugosimonospora africana]GIH21342.1 hypothetical protein Raf01_95140 [Rugosimonospora africana]